jgi:hypothetical protein
MFPIHVLNSSVTPAAILIVICGCQLKYQNCSWTKNHPEQPVLTKQVGAVPSAVIRGSIGFKDFWCHRRVKVSHNVTMCHIYLISLLAFFAFLHFFVSLSLLFVTSLFGGAVSILKGKKSASWLSSSLD